MNIMTTVESLAEQGLVQEQAQAANHTGPSIIEKFVIRLPAGLRDQVKHLSEQNRRSMNAEIIMVLENHVRQQLVQQLLESNDTGNYHVGQRPAEAAFDLVLESLPQKKKTALIELLSYY
jgi:hypothetical protein